MKIIVTKTFKSQHSIYPGGNDSVFDDLVFEGSLGISLL